MTTPESVLERPFSNGRAVLWSAVSALGVALAGLTMIIALALVSWSLDHSAGATTQSAAVVGIQAWLLANGASLSVGSGALSLPPLMVTGLIGYLFYRSGRSIVRRCNIGSHLGVLEALIAVGVTYVTAAFLLTSLGTTSAVTPGLLKLGLICAVLSMVPTGVGMLAESGLGQQLVHRAPGPSHAYLRGATAGLLALCGMSAILFVASLVINFNAASAMIEALGPTNLSGLTVTALAILFLPNALLYIGAFSLGAGFSVGAGTHVGLLSVQLGPLPAFPLFAVMPDQPSVLTWFSVLAPVVAAIAASLVFVRNLETDERGVGRLAAGVAGMGIGIGASLCAITLLGSGGIGAERLASLGPSPLRIALFGAVVMGVLIAIATYAVNIKGVAAALSARRRDSENREAGTPDADPVVADGSEPAEDEDAEATDADESESDDEDSADDTDESGAQGDDEASTEEAADPDKSSDSEDSGESDESETTESDAEESDSEADDVDDCDTTRIDTAAIAARLEDGRQRKAS